MIKKIAGAVLAGAVALTALSGCTAADQRYIGAFTEPRKQPEKTVEVRDPSTYVADPVYAGTTAYTVKVWGETDSYRVYVDGDQINRTDQITVPIKIKVESKMNSVVVYGKKQSYMKDKKRAGCTILDDAGHILDTAYTKISGRLFTCTYEGN